MRTERPGGPAVPPALLAEVAKRHGLRVGDEPPVRRVGATSQVYLLADAAVKVPYPDPEAIAAVLTDARVSPAMRAAGVRTPRLLALDEDHTFFPVPFAVFERVTGDPLDPRGAEGDRAADTWRELGRDLALVHALAPTGPLAGLRTFSQSPEVDPRGWLADLVRAGRLDAGPAGWLAGVLDRLAPAALAAVERRVCHGDVNAANVIVQPAALRFLAVVDWAGAGELDPVWDVAGVPLAAVPPLLEGHRRVAPLPDDDTAEARVLWCHVQLALHDLLNRDPADRQDRAAAERLVAGARRFATAAGLA